METKICKKCGEEKNIEDFSFRDKTKGTRRCECKKCHSETVRLAYHKKKNEIRELKSQCTCAKCGDSRGYVLDYHHVNPEEKENNISRMTSHGASKEDIMNEISKCIVLCANCHREFHYFQEQDNNYTLTDYLA